MYPGNHMHGRSLAGQRIVMHPYRDVDGRVYRSVAELVQERGLSPSLIEAIEDFKQRLPSRCGAGGSWLPAARIRTISAASQLPQLPEEPITPTPPSGITSVSLLFTDLHSTELWSYNCVACRKIACSPY